MKQDKNQLFSEFEKEVWLYLDKELPEERMQFWESQIAENHELSQYLDEYFELSKTFEEANSEGLGDRKFNLMIDNAIAKNTIISKIEYYFSNIFSTDTEFSFGKIAFASVLIVGAIAISLLSNRSNPVVKITESINSELLEWDADFVDNQINRVGTLLKVASDDEYRKYYKYKTRSSSVEKNINLIDRDIKSLKEELNSREL